jgi:hypothetical protein
MAAATAVRAAGLSQAVQQIRRAIEDLCEAKWALEDPADVAIWHEFVPLAVLGDLEHRLAAQLAAIENREGQA